MKRLFIILGMFLLLGTALTSAVAATTAATGGKAQGKGARPGLALDTPTATPTCPPSWTVVTSPTIGLTNVDTEFYGMDALASNDVWAVGVYYTDTTSAGATDGTRQKHPDWLAPHRDHTRRADRTDGYYVTPLALIDQWNGSSWTVITGTNVGADANLLLSVDAVSAGDAWAVGYYVSDYGVAQTLIKRWDGTTWNLVPSANTGALMDNQLFGVQAVSANDVWAVGTASNDEGVFESLIEHWNGTTWSIVSSPNVSTYENILRDLAVVSANDIWAVGQYTNFASYATRAVTMHWNGTAWSIVANPGVGSGTNTLNGVDAVSASNVWAVGEFHAFSGGNRALVEHWDGTAWNVVPISVPGADYAGLEAVDAISANDIWAVGYYEEQNSYTHQALTEHWNGTNWTRVRSAVVEEPYFDNDFVSVAAIAANDVWAAGEISEYGGFYGREALAEHYSTDCIPLNCRITFSDVHESDYFYYPVLYMYCRQIVSGYEDNTFRPGLNTTRAQLSKIIVLAEGWSLVNPQSSHFVDVFPWDTFYQYIETAYAHGLVSGYSCGIGCLEFRPGNSVTRAQLSKIIVLAQGWSIYTPPAPTFVDVPASDPFYGYIETAYNHGIISGYSCGTACLQFRPGNNATRGQIAKIVYSAVTQP